MLLLTALCGLAEWSAASLVQSRLGVVGTVLLFGLGVGIRARHEGLAVGAAVVLVVLLSQA